MDLLSSAPSRAVIETFFQVCFSSRRLDPSPEAIAYAVQHMRLPSEDASRLVSACTGVVRALVYESSEVAGKDDVMRFLPEGIEPRLKQLVAGVRSVGECTLQPPPPTPLTPTPQVLHAAWPAWREAAIEGRPGMPRFSSASWRVEALHGASALASPSEPMLQLSLSVVGARTESAQGNGSGTTPDAPPVTDIPLALNGAALGSLLVGMRRVKDAMEKLAR